MGIIQFIRQITGKPSDAQKVNQFLTDLEVTAFDIRRDFTPRSLTDMLMALECNGMYSHETDQVFIRNSLPEIEWTATALHELAHWTGHVARLGRPWVNTGKRQILLHMGEDLNAYRNHEECVADMGAKFLAQYLQLDWNEDRHQAYLKLFGVGVDMEAVKRDAGQVVAFCKRRQALARVKARLAA
jgi:hypothetical protein